MYLLLCEKQPAELWRSPACFESPGKFKLTKNSFLHIILYFTKTLSSIHLWVDRYMYTATFFVD